MKILIINSKGHWVHGWFSSKPDLQTGATALNSAGFFVKSIEVNNLKELDNALDKVTPGTLIWPNAYFVKKENSGLAWINESIEKRNLNYLGSNKTTLEWVLNKGICQNKLAKNNSPIPDFTIVTRKNFTKIGEFIFNKQLEFPLVLKPTSESGSIGVCMATNMAELKKHTYDILNKHPNSDVIIEEFLPSDDITCGYVQLGDKYLLMPTSYIVKSAAGKENILEREVRMRPWDDVDKLQPPVTNHSVISQLKKEIPKIARALKINGVTRIDGRMDRNGELKFFDVNGLPALCYPEGVLVKQCLSCFPDYEPMQVFSGLLHTLVYHSLLINNMAIPDALKKHNLFTMKSNFVYSGTIYKQQSLKKELLF